MKKVIAFDLDGTLAESKSALPGEMSLLLGKLLKKYEVCVISGGKFEQFEEQLLGNLKVDSSLLGKLHLMPTCGTRFFQYDFNIDNWRQIYAEDFTVKDKEKIINALKGSAKDLGLLEPKPWGEIIEDRGSQITFSALGQEAPVDEKKKWDPDGSKKMKLRNLVAERIPEYEVRTGGSTSVDVTKLGIDKAYGMKKLEEMLKIKKDEILFIGDALHEGGNDYPVKAYGIDCIGVDGWRETAKVLEGILGVAL